MGTAWSMKLFGESKGLSLDYRQILLLTIRVQRSPCPPDIPGAGRQGHSMCLWTSAQVEWSRVINTRTSKAC